MFIFCFFFFNDTATTEIYTFPTRRSSDLISNLLTTFNFLKFSITSISSSLIFKFLPTILIRSEEHTSELQSQSNLVCRLLLEKKKKRHQPPLRITSPRTNVASRRAHTAPI